MQKHTIIKSVYVLIGLALVCLISIMYSKGTLEFSLSGYATGILVAGVSIFGFLQAKVKGVSLYAFYLALILLLPIPTLIYHMLYCAGKFCDLLDYPASIVLFGLSIGTIVVYYLGKFLVKRGYLFTFMKYLYGMIVVLLVIEIPLYVAIKLFDYDIYSVESWFNTFASFFVDVSLAAIPTLLFAIYPLKIAEAEYMDKGGVVNKNN